MLVVQNHPYSDQTIYLCGNHFDNHLSTDGMLQKAGYAIPFQETEVLLWPGDPPSIYKDKTGQWQGTNRLSLNDLPKAILALQKAFEYLTAK